MTRPSATSRGAAAAAQGAPVLSARALLGIVDAVGDRDGQLGFRSLAAAIEVAIRVGDVPDGARLPPERSLAAQSGLSRGTVVAAYDLLREDGLVLRRQGSGTYVRSPISSGPPAASPELDAALRARRLTSRVLRPAAPDHIDLGLSALVAPWQLDRSWFDVATDDLVRAGQGHGYLPNGIDELRSALDPDGRPERVAITHGAQHAIALAARVLVHPGDTVVLEHPTFPGAIDAFSRVGARFATVPTDSAGADVDRIASLLQGASVRAVYVVPTCHSPTGSVMPIARRRQLASIIDASDCWLIEDETLAPLRFGAADPPPSVASFGRSDRFITLGSLAKQVWGGLRVGWLRAPATTVERVGRLRAALDLGASVHAQLVASRCLVGLEDRTAALCDELERRSDLMQRSIAERLPGWSVTQPEGGLSLWCELPEPRADRLAALAPAHGVSVLPGSSTSSDAGLESHLRMCFAGDPELLRTGVARLARAWEELRRSDLRAAPGRAAR